jgi:hypothetical protein
MKVSSHFYEVSCDDYFEGVEQHVGHMFSTTVPNVAYDRKSKEN